MKARSTPEEAQCKQMLPRAPTHTSIECVTARRRNQFINLFLFSFLPFALYLIMLCRLIIRQALSPRNAKCQ